MGGKVITLRQAKAGSARRRRLPIWESRWRASTSRVALIDADIGLRNLDIVMGLENRIVYDLVDIVEGRCKLRQAMIRHKMFPELYLIPAAQTRDKTAVSPADMIQLTDYLRAGIRLHPDRLARRDRARLSQCRRPRRRSADRDQPGSFRRARRRPRDRAAGSRKQRAGAADPEPRQRRKWCAGAKCSPPDDVTDLLAIRLIGIVPEDDTVVPSSNSGIPVTLNENSRAGMAYRNIARRLMGENVPFMQLGESERLLQAADAIVQR